MRHILRIITVVALTVVGGCDPAYLVDQSIAKYELVEGQIQLGDSKDIVIPLLDRSQAQLGSSERKRPEKYMKGNTLVEIYYVRSGRQADGLKTDDEFTPYIFNNGKLVAIGWTAIGGPKTQGQASPTTNVYFTNRTIVY
jgi:hypothetical protein